MGKPGPFLPVDTRQFALGMALADRHAKFSRSYSAHAVPKIDSDWHFKSRKAEMEASKSGKH